MAGEAGWVRAGEHHGVDRWIFVGTINEGVELLSQLKSEQLVVTTVDRDNQDRSPLVG
ncbi:hypothetical protein GOTRE_150_01250 [Gordonia terrae NBRC 100016]|uniref:Uncharacterized protein n=1 Tax=Gordonia terrae NBRC 100016 TaxID=1089454 RepID=A0ABQ0HKH6_9ACTN|nr:hypothetical protein GOTRE_150_01250 [Gordonia terrae NBRC 100016]